MGRSILDDLGEEVTGVTAPVTICMALTVVLVRLLNPEGSADTSAVRLASLYYREQVRLLYTIVIMPLRNLFYSIWSASSYLVGMFVLQEGDSTGQKLSGSVINAIIFVSIIAAMTFVLVLLFKYRVRWHACTVPAGL